MLRDILMFYQLKIFAGHFKLLGGPHLARGPDVAQAWVPGVEHRAVVPNQGAVTH